MGVLAQSHSSRCSHSITSAFECQAPPALHIPTFQDYNLNNNNRGSWKALSSPALNVPKHTAASAAGSGTILSRRDRRLSCSSMYHLPVHTALCPATALGSAQYHRIPPLKNMRCLLLFVLGEITTLCHSSEGRAWFSHSPTQQTQCKVPQMSSLALQVLQHRAPASFSLCQQHHVAEMKPSPKTGTLRYNLLQFLNHFST